MKKKFKKLYKKGCQSYYQYLYNILLKDEKKFIVTANPETFMYAEADKDIMQIFNMKDASIVPDGIGIVRAAHILGNDIKERIAGIDIAEKLLVYCNELNKSLYLFGSKQEVIDAMKKVIKDKYPNIILSGATNGYVKDKDEVMNKISKLNPDVVMVALGIPAQEKLIYKHFNQFKKGVFIGVGGSFDVLSGMKKRAPKIFIKTNTEWLYRIIREPKRFKRFWDNNVKFMIKVYHEKKYN